MNISYKPAGYSTVSPYLIVKDAQRVVDFLQSVFDATEMRRFERPDGSIKHLEVKIEDSIIMIGEAMAHWPANTMHLHIYVQDVDATYRRALQAGGTSLQEPSQQDDPDRRAGVSGPGGNSWWFATQMNESTPGQSAQ